MGSWRAITIAILWAALVFGVYFSMIFAIGPFNDWSASQQMQLFQGMVGLAGFGAGGVALFFVAQQISLLFARPVLKVRFQALELSDNFYLRAEPEDDPQEITTTVASDLRLSVEVTNIGATICSAWRMDLLVTGAKLGAYSSRWQQVPANDRLSRQAREHEALYPDSPLVIDDIAIKTVGIGRPSVLKLTAKIVTEHRVSTRHLTIYLLAEASAEA